jgi:hypothetical protein
MNAISSSACVLALISNASIPLGQRGGAVGGIVLGPQRVVEAHPSGGGPGTISRVTGPGGGIVTSDGGPGSVTAVALHSGGTLGPGGGIIPARRVPSPRRPGGPHRGPIPQLPPRGYGLEPGHPGAPDPPRFEASRSRAEAAEVRGEEGFQLVLDLAGRPGTRFGLFATDLERAPILLGIVGFPEGRRARAVVKASGGDSPTEGSVRRGPLQLHRRPSIRR